MPKGSPVGVRGTSVVIYDGATANDKWTRTENNIVTERKFGLDFFNGALTKMVNENEDVRDLAIAGFLSRVAATWQQGDRTPDADVLAVCDALAAGTFTPPESKGRTPQVIGDYRRFVDAMAQAVEGFNAETNTVRVNGSPVTFASLFPDTEVKAAQFKEVKAAYLASKKYGPKLIALLNKSTGDVAVEID